MNHHDPKDTTLWAMHFCNEDHCLVMRWKITFLGWSQIFQIGEILKSIWTWWWVGARLFCKSTPLENVNRILDFLLRSFKLLFLLGIGGPRLNQSALQPIESVNTPETKESSGLGTKIGDRLCTSFVAFRGATMGLSDVHFVLCTLKKWTVHLKYYRYCSD